MRRGDIFLGLIYIVKMVGKVDFGGFYILGNLVIVDGDWKFKIVFFYY